MTENRFSIFSSLVKLPYNQVLSVVYNYLNKHYKEVHKGSKYVYAIGNIPVALVAHADTVFQKPPDEIFYDQKQKVIWGGSNGLGADDRAGIFAILEIINRGYCPHVIITTDEELGSIGARTLITEVKEPFAEIKYFIELDRRGRDDCVFYQCDNKEFSDYISSFGFIEKTGTFSDISEICPAWRIAGVNLSIGYVDEHTYSERLYVNYMYETIEKVVKLLEDADNITAFEYNSMTPFEYYQKSSRLDSWCNGAILRCHKCGAKNEDYEMFYVQEQDGSNRFWCPDCVSTKAGWCEICGEPFETTANNTKFCYDCLEVLVNDKRD